MNSIKELLKRHYTKELETNPDKTVFDLFHWEKRDVVLKDFKSGKILTEMRDLEFPDFYSQNAVDIIASKYFRKAGVNNGLGYENSMRMIADRMVAFWRDALAEEGILKTAEDKAVFYDEMVYALLNQMYAPNSPQWFNTGLNQSYGITGNPNNTYYYDPAIQDTVLAEDAYTRTQASACFILSIEDKLLGPHSISEQYVSETKLFKGGSGTGTNFSALRASGEKLLRRRSPSGLMSFPKAGPQCGAIRSGGTTRRLPKWFVWISTTRNRVIYQLESQKRIKSGLWRAMTVLLKAKPTKPYPARIPITLCGSPMNSWKRWSIWIRIPVRPSP